MMGFDGCLSRTIADCGGPVTIIECVRSGRRDLLPRCHVQLRQSHFVGHGEGRRSPRRFAGLEVAGFVICERGLVRCDGPPTDNIREEWAESPKGSGLWLSGVTFG